MSRKLREELPVIPHREPAPQWLQASHEEPLLPQLAIIDSHHHFSDHWGGYQPSDLLRDADGHHVQATVYIQSGWHQRATGPDHLMPVGEVEAVVAATPPTEGSPRLAAAIVAYADLRLGAAVDEVLQQLEHASGGRLRGIRNSGAWHPGFRHGVLARPPQGLYSDPSFRAGYARLAAHRLSFDAFIYHTQIPEVVDLARAFPDVPLVLDHIGVPLGVAEYASDPARSRREWEAGMRQLSLCPNAYVKFGGFGATVFGYDFTSLPKPPTSEQLAHTWQPLLDTTLELFGDSRCMFETNYPVDRSVAGYGVLWNTFKRMTGRLPESARQALFHDNAAAVYRI
jgi:predicted TIM-barrel fold metal-dependent hydrolase